MKKKRWLERLMQKSAWPVCVSVFVCVFVYVCVCACVCKSVLVYLNY